MKRRTTTISLTVILLAALMLSACGAPGGKNGDRQPGGAQDAQTSEESALNPADTTKTNVGSKSESESPGAAGSQTDQSSGAPDLQSEQPSDAAQPGTSAEEADGEDLPAVRRSPLKAETTSVTVDVNPAVTPYTVAEDLSNVANLGQYYLQDEVKELLVKNGFSVDGSAGNEFFEIYENNRYQYMPNFVTVDSLMHTYHLYFSYLMKNLEKNYLSDCILNLSRRMTDAAAEYYEQLKGTGWEDAARRDLLLFSVGLKLLDDSAQLNPDVQADAEAELGRISEAASILPSGITGKPEDYSQYIPRGYYEGNELLERYFRAMMLYGRAHFVQGDDGLDQSAILITKMFADDEEAYRLWQSVYDVTAFFVGASDDLGVDQYLPILEKVYGDAVTVRDLAADEDGFKQFQNLASRFAAPAINSVPADASGDSATLGFRFMGQRFTIDAAIMQLLVHDSVTGRMLPDVLDVPAALGSETAMAVLDETGASHYEGYDENMSELQNYLSGDNTELWSASLYAGWLDTLRPLLEKKGEGYPMFMQNEEWRKKDLECFAGSFTELKHDTVLYTKQVIAEMGGGFDEVDDRGYVEPEPSVYARFAALAERTAEGLKKYGMLSADNKEDLTRLTQIAETLQEISVKELQDKVLADEEYDFIRNYGGTLEHFWIESVSGAEGGISTQESPAALVVDVATGEGSVLEMATDTPSLLRVIVNVDGQLKIATGSVYSFYQFEWPADDRLTDSRWRQMRGLAIDESGFVSRDTSIKKPSWTLSYRYLYGWE